MKMEHTLRANRDGRLTKIFFKEGDQVEGDVELAAITSEEATG
jgi:biotin carboxyl carrier protein